MRDGESADVPRESSSSIEWEETSKERMNKQDLGWNSMRK